MEQILLLAISIIVIVVIVYVGFWIISQIGLPHPADLIARAVLGVICLLLFLSLFIPSLGLGLSLR